MKRNPEQIRDLSVEAYKIRLEDDCPEVRDSKGNVTRKGNVQRMLEKDAAIDPDDNGKMLRGRASSYDVLTRTYLKVLKMDELD